MSDKLNSHFFGRTPPPSPARAFHSAYEARLKSPSSKNVSKSPLHSIGNSSAQLNAANKKSPVTPKRNRSNSVYSDRFIPSRSGSQVDVAYCLLDNPPKKRSNSTAISEDNTKNIDSKDDSTFSILLKTELLGIDANLQYHERQNENLGYSPRNLFRFKSNQGSPREDNRNNLTLSPVSNVTQRIISSPKASNRKISKVPFKVLDAPALVDDFYLNLVDWSSQNVLAVGLGSCVYLWSAHSSSVTKLCDLGTSDSVTSVSWAQKGTHVSVGTNGGDVQIWDAITFKRVRTLSGHSARVGTMSWSNNIVASGSRDRSILQRDIRTPDQFVGEFSGHKQEICGLRWSFDGQQLASGGNDNKLFIWSAHSSNHIAKFSDHTAAVKAIAWSPHQHGLLASGGGTADRCIRFWNTLTTRPVNCIDTGSQVCNLMWSKNVNEIVSTHGYSLNQIIIWKYPSMNKIATLTGHTFRVLYLAMSPDGQTIVTGAGDETLRFWNTFPCSKSKSGSRLGSGLLFPMGGDIR